MNVEEFWSTAENGKVSLNNFLFKSWLEHNKFFKNFPNQKSDFNFIKKEGIFLEIKEDAQIKDFVLDYILDNNIEEKVFNMISSRTSIFKRDFLSMIKTEEIKILRDTKDTCYLFFQNGIVEVTSDSTILKSYQDYNINVWKDQVIKRNYIQSDHHDSEYRTFIWKISGEDVERYNSFQTVIGYLLHSYNTSSISRAIILNDELISDDPNGRSGKGLFWNAISHLKKVTSINGKGFSFNSSFPYQSVQTDCQLLVFDDVNKGFQFEKLFSVITEGIDITYKGENTIKLGISESPKILITTNYTLKGSGGSHDARKFELELSTFFNSSHTPIDFFGHRLFDDWDEKEWARFDSYMMECIKKYLKTGLVPYKAISLPFKKLQLEITKELFECIETVAKNEWINADEFYNLYLSNMQRKFDAKTKNMVTKYIKKYCEFYGLEYESTLSNGIKKFMIKQKGLDVKSELPF
jgi:hypothetical protein